MCVCVCVSVRVRVCGATEGSECYTRETVTSGHSSGLYSTLPIARFSEEERKVSLIKAPHYEGIGPVDETGIPIAIRTVRPNIHCSGWRRGWSVRPNIHCSGWGTGW